MTNKATLIKRSTIELTGARQRVYRLDPPHKGHEYVLVSAVAIPLVGTETVVFVCDADGKIDDECTTLVTVKNMLSHAGALLRLDYDAPSDPGDSYDASRQEAEALSAGLRIARETGIGNVAQIERQLERARYVGD